MEAQGDLCIDDFPTAPYGFNHAVSKVLKLIISNLLEVAEKVETSLEKEIHVLW